MRGAVAAIFALLAIGLFLGSITMNWPSLPSDWSPDSYDVGWGRYALALAMAVLALVIWRGHKLFKGHGRDDKYKRLVTYGIGRKENKIRRNPWPKRRLQ